MIRKIPTRRSVLKRAASNLLDTLNANWWLVPVGGLVLFMIVNFPN